MLFRSEANTSDEAETYQKLKQKLVDAGIPAEQFAIRTGGVDEIGSTDLMDRRCPIRFVITVEALAEGWDCPFAYILATVANKNSRVSVEQIIGRILRQPYAHRSKAHSLNISYVLTSSGDFNQTIDQVIAGLNGAGFSKRDLRAGGIQSPAPQTQPKPHQGTFDELTHDGAVDDVSDDDLTLAFPDNNTHSGDATHETAGTESDGSIDDIIEDAEKTEEDFQNQAKEEAEQARESGTGLGDGMNQFKIREAVAASIEGLQIGRAHV